MMFDLPDDEILYAALLGRDAAWDGRAWVGVSSTGVFCRLTCPARKPKRENCTFFDTMGGAIEAGYRACKRCHPMAPAAEGEPAVKALLAALEADPARRWAEGDVAAMGFDLSTVRRAFKRHFGMTFLEMARLARLRAGGAELVGGASVIEAQMEAGYASGSAFRAAFAGWTGLAPGAFVKDAVLRADWIETPMGAMVAVASEHALHLLEFTERKALPAELAALRTDAKGSLGFGRFGLRTRSSGRFRILWWGCRRILKRRSGRWGHRSLRKFGGRCVRSLRGRRGAIASLPARWVGLRPRGLWRVPMGRTRLRL